MPLVPIPPASDSPLWVNPDHVVSLRKIVQRAGESVTLTVELKLVGMNLERVRLGAFGDETTAEQAWEDLLGLVGR